MYLSNTPLTFILLSVIPNMLLSFSNFSLLSAFVKMSAIWSWNLQKDQRYLLILYLLFDVVMMYLHMFCFLNEILDSMSFL